MELDTNTIIGSGFQSTFHFKNMIKNSTSHVGHRVLLCSITVPLGIIQNDVTQAWVILGPPLPSAT
jgi:hypothetical protein